MLVLPQFFGNSICPFERGEETLRFPKHKETPLGSFFSDICWWNTQHFLNEKPHFCEAWETPKYFSHCYKFHSVISLVPSQFAVKRLAKEWAILFSDGQPVVAFSPVKI